MKIKLIPPLICRRGSILLTGKNVTIVSDKVIEELQEEFDLKSILSNKIGTEYVGPVQVANQIPTRNANRQNTHPLPARNGEFVKKNTGLTRAENGHFYFKNKINLFSTFLNKSQPT